ncbi:porin family protein [Bradyrhizobium sp. ISRA443]|uniref:outer membrane protein n=1 Tax=unclassified Bradyrhizobium TaxID=2631580 RepID=UPI00247A0E64|nr:MULTISPECIES: outer membrane protein [unclassified Bradyrhizobium]WGR92057.1 porin family protein [Bradyrhizobium sp. ISRA435]WGS02500.1 porin family protein [Bradyrhizobium sp. ISRA436]WGS09385.1 porin family protein [Bradyrhizobium sp. ISRA437]WGS16274.1 porin family protein [Bradyrhizobium sp. ISRA443]
MKTVLLASAGLLVLSAFAPASAADMAARAPYVKAPPPAAIYNWTGFYLGGFGGYASENTDASPKMSGGFAGGTIGYNWQAGNIVYGLEADGGWADVDASVTALGITIKSRIDSLGTVRGRIGFAVDKVLFYGTGGYAWIDNKLSLSALGVTVSESHFHSGWTVGAGIEAFFAPQWSVKGEYLYRSLGSENYFGVPSGDLNLHSVQVGVNYHFGGPIVARY